MLDVSRYELIDWDDPEVDVNPETNNLHCQQGEHLGMRAEMIVYQLFYDGLWAEVQFRMQTAEYAVVGTALAGPRSVRRFVSGKRRPGRRGRGEDDG